MAMLSLPVDPVPEGPHPAAPEARRILVVANRTCPCAAMLDEVRGRAALMDAEIVIVAPALNRRARHWVSDVDGAVAAAKSRLEGAVASLREAGYAARGEIGDADPVQAIEDSLAVFPASEIIVSTHPPGRSNWLEKGLIERARERFDGPITHVISREGMELAAS